MKAPLAYLITMLGAGMFAQDFVTQRARMTGSNFDRGKCTIEVEVDGVAEVNIRGDEGRLYTLAGSPANWRRFECNGVMPRTPEDFRFRGIDGRGRQSLAADPRQNRGIAIVRIEDPKGGREGYTFDIEWQGVDRNGGGWTGGGGGGGRPGRGQGDGFGGGRGTGGGFRSDDRIDGGMANAVRDCSDEVSRRLSRDGYSKIKVMDAAIDNNVRRNDWVTGTVRAARGSQVEEFRFECSVNLSNGRLRDVNINRR